jgi:hypothetical protein
MRNDIETNALAGAFPAELSKGHDAYDPGAELLTRERYTGDGDAELVHALRPSLSYGVALLDTGDEAYRDRAYSVIDTVLGYQVRDSDSAVRGTWPYATEDARVDASRLDPNWAAFLGRELVYLLADHPDVLPDGLTSRVADALERAARCQLRRDVLPAYTNIAAMSAFVLVATGELLDDEELVGSGRRSLRELVGYTRYHDGFTEYNSPTYTVITLGEIGRMLGYFADATDRAHARVLNDYVWRSLATHYDPGTGTLAGPHSRAYDDALHDDEGGISLRSIVHAGTDGAYGIEDPADLAFFETDPPMDFNWHKTVLDCPDSYRTRFAAGGPLFVRDRFYDGAGEDRPPSDLTPHEAPGPVEARTYLSPSFSLGSFTTSHCWGQRRPVVGYWGDRTEPHYLRVRCLRDGRDYLPAVLAVSQYANHIVGALSFLTDYYDAAAGDSAAGSMRARSLRLRFEVGTEFTRSRDDIAVEEADRTGALVRAGEVDVDVDVLAVDFEPGAPAVSTGAGRDPPAVRESTWVDVVLYDGDERTVDLEALSAAVVVFGLSLRADDPARTAPGSPTYTVERLADGRLRASTPRPAVPSSVTVPLAPCRYAAYTSRTAIDDAAAVDADGHSEP